jgi:hypothetical protein
MNDPIEERVIAGIRKAGGWRTITLDCGHQIRGHGERNWGTGEVAIGKPMNCVACGWGLSRKYYVGGHGTETFIRTILRTVDDPISGEPGRDYVIWMDWSRHDGEYIGQGCCHWRTFARWVTREATEEEIART